MKRASGESALSTLAETHRHPLASRCRGKRESGKKGSTPDTGRAPLLAVLAAHDGVCHTLSQCAPAQPCRTGAPRPPRVPAPREKGVLCCERREQQQQRSANVQRQVRPVDAHRGERVCGWAQRRAPRCGVYGLCCKRERLETTCKQAWTRFASPPPSLGCSRPALTLTRPCPAPIYGNA